MIRKSKEYVTLKCASLCFQQVGNNFYDDDLNRKEKTCLLNCYHKTFRYLTHANTAYTYLTSDPEKIKDLLDDEGPDYNKDGVGLKEGALTDPDGREYFIPSREEMQKI